MKQFVIVIFNLYICRVKFRGDYNNEVIIKKIIDEGVDILLQPGPVSQYLSYKNFFSALGTSFINSKEIDYFEFNNIAAKYYTEYKPILAYFRCFSIPVWLLIMVSILFLTVSSKLTKYYKKINFGNYFWN